MCSSFKRGRCIMKSKAIVLLLISICIMLILTSCSRYEKDSSYDTDLCGDYSENIEATNTSYFLNESYIFNTDNTYLYIYKEIIDGIVTNDINKSGKILSVEEISDDISKITLDQEVVKWSTQESSSNTLYKYKNMIGEFLKIEVPDGKTFELHLNKVWYDEDGQYHTCADINKCNCKETCPQYIRKNDMIYFQSMDEEHKNCYTISAYIMEDGLFFPELKKE